MATTRKNYRKSIRRKGKKRNQYSGSGKRNSKHSGKRGSSRSSISNKKCKYPNVCTKGGTHEWNRYSSGIRICTKCRCKLYFKDNTEPEFNSEPDIDFGIWH